MTADLDIHPFVQDPTDAGNPSCETCNLPKANQRHWTMREVHERSIKTLEQYGTELSQVREKYAKQSWICLVTRIKAEDPAARYVSFNVDTAYDKGHTWTTCYVDLVLRDGATAYATWADPPGDMTLTPDFDATELDTWGWGYTILVDQLDVTPDDMRVYWMDLDQPEFTKALLDDEASGQMRDKVQAIDDADRHAAGDQPANGR